MKITYDEFIAVCQSPEQKEDLDKKILIDNQRRYNSRMNGVGTDSQSSTMLQSMSPSQYNTLRAHQMGQLLQAYRDANSGKIPHRLSIQSTTTDPEHIRRVIGNNPGYIYHTGPMALDYETIVAIQHLATLMGSTNNSSLEKSWAKNITPTSMVSIVDEMITVKGLLAQQEKLPYPDLIGDKIYRETNLAKRAIGKHQPNYSGMPIPGGGYIEEELFTTNQKGKNVFGIEDYSLSWEELSHRKTNVFSRISHAISSKVKEIFTDKDKLKLEKAKMGNRVIDLGGER